MVNWLVMSSFSNALAGQRPRGRFLFRHCREPCSTCQTFNSYIIIIIIQIDLYTGDMGFPSDLQILL